MGYDDGGVDDLIGPDDQDDQYLDQPVEVDMPAGGDADMGEAAISEGDASGDLGWGGDDSGEGSEELGY